MHSFVDTGQDRSWTVPSQNRTWGEKWSKSASLQVRPKRRRSINWEGKKKSKIVSGVTASYGTAATLVSVLPPKMKGWKWRFPLRPSPKPTKQLPLFEIHNYQKTRAIDERRNNREKEEIGKNSVTLESSCGTVALLKAEQRKQKEEVVVEGQFCCESALVKEEETWTSASKLKSVGSWVVKDHKS